MIRILQFLLLIVLIAGTITFVAGLEGRIQGEAFGWKFNGSSGLIVGGFVLLIIAVSYLTGVVKDLMALPAKMRAREAKARREKGIVALTRGLEAVAVGDASDAVHHARIARRHLDEMSLTRLLSAQAAQMNGDDIAARDSFSAMLEAPETEFLGLRGLYLQAMARNDKDAARAHAERAFALRANAKWAFQSVFDLALERGAWGDARAALVKARKNKLLPSVEIDRADAVLLSADAASVLLAGDEKTAVGEVEAALKLAPGFTPAAVTAARLYGGQGRKAKAVKILEHAFAVAPHPALARALGAVCTDEKAETRAQAFARLADKAADSPEAILLRARRDLLQEDHDAAIARLEPLLADAPTAETLTLMAEAMTAKHGEAAARGWYEHAASAPRDPRPGADGEFHFTREGWAQLVREYMAHGRLSPPPLEAAHFRLSTEEIKLLAAPPVLAAADDAEAESQEEAEDDFSKVTVPQGDLSRGEEPVPETTSTDEDDHIHNDEEADRAATAARKVS